MIAAGIMPMLAAFDVGMLTHADINGPPWLGVVSGGVFLLAGLMILCAPLPEVLNGLLSAVLITGLASLGGWVAFGTGMRACSSNISLPFLTGSGQFSNLACRIPFGIGAIICSATVCLIVATTLQKAAGGKPHLARLVRATEWLMLTSLLPILLPLLIFGIASILPGVLWTRLKTGAWPRNEAFIARSKARLKSKSDR
jgi:hypothetical protein